MILRWACMLLVAVSFAAAAAEERAAQTVVHLLDYIGTDYGGAVAGGRVKDADEYKEMIEFSTQVVEQVKALPDNPKKAQLLKDAQALGKRVAAMEDPAAIADGCGKLRWAVIGAYGIAVAPRRAPDLRAAAALYTQNCASCHGAQGRGDGPAARGMDPQPANFHDRERMEKRSTYGLYNTITLGVAGTAMPAFNQLSEDERWALAFYVSSIGKPAPLAYARENLKQALDAYRRGEQTQAQQLAVAAYLEGFEPVEPALDAVDHDLRTAIEGAMLRFRNLIRDHAPPAELTEQAATISAALDRAEERLSGRDSPPAALR